MRNKRIEFVVRRHRRITVGGFVTLIVAVMIILSVAWWMLLRLVGQG